MNKLMIGALAIAAAAAPLSAAQACNGALLGQYNAEISRRDTVNSSGTRLTSVGLILQQDRANVHRFGRADNGDGHDDMFGSAESRALIPRWLHQVEPAAASRIRGGNGGYITVEVYEGCIDVMAF